MVNQNVLTVLEENATDARKNSNVTSIIQKAIDSKLSSTEIYASGSGFATDPINQSATSSVTFRKYTVQVDKSIINDEYYEDFQPRRKTIKFKKG
jgi:hypothetical protein